MVPRWKQGTLEGHLHPMEDNSSDLCELTARVYREATVCLLKCLLQTQLAVFVFCILQQAPGGSISRCISDLCVFLGRLQAHYNVVDPAAEPCLR